MGACIKEFVIVNNYGNLLTGDNLRDTSFSATKSYSGAGGPVCIDIVVVIGDTNKVCLQPGDTVTTTITRGGNLASNGTGNGTENESGRTGALQAAPNTDNMDSVGG